MPPLQSLASEQMIWNIWKPNNENECHEIYGKNNKRVVRQYQL
jgi:hypothetical protein